MNVSYYVPTCTQWLVRTTTLHRLLAAKVPVQVGILNGDKPHLRALTHTMLQQLKVIMGPSSPVAAEPLLRPRAMAIINVRNIADVLNDDAPAHGPRMIPDPNKFELKELQRKWAAHYHTLNNSTDGVHAQIKPVLKQLARQIEQVVNAKGRSGSFTTAEALGKAIHATTCIGPDYDRWVITGLGMPAEETPLHDEMPGMEWRPATPQQVRDFRPLTVKTLEGGIMRRHDRNTEANAGGPGLSVPLGWKSPPVHASLA